MRFRRPPVADPALGSLQPVVPLRGGERRRRLDRRAVQRRRPEDFAAVAAAEKKAVRDDVEQRRVVAVAFVHEPPVGRGSDLRAPGVEEVLGDEIQLRHPLLARARRHVRPARQRGVQPVDERVQDVQAGQKPVEVRVLLVEHGRGEDAVPGERGHRLAHGGGAGHGDHRGRGARVQEPAERPPEQQTARGVEVGRRERRLGGSGGLQSPSLVLIQVSLQRVAGDLGVRHVDVAALTAQDVADRALPSRHAEGRAVWQFSGSVVAFSWLSRASARPRRLEKKRPTPTVRGDYYRGTVRVHSIE